jgi:hypothetical protein
MQVRKGKGAMRDSCPRAAFARVFRAFEVGATGCSSGERRRATDGLLGAGVCTKGVVQSLRLNWLLAKMSVSVSQ